MIVLPAGLLPACGRRPQTRPRVSIMRAPGYGAELLDPIRRALTEHGLAVRGKRVLLKPNLVEFDEGAPINTHPAFTAAVLEAFRSLGAAEVRIAEGPAIRPDAFEIAEAAGYFQAIPDFERLFLDLNYDDVAPVRLPRGGARLRTIYVAQTALACDLVVSLPKMKTHRWAGVTLGMKNLFGFVPGSVYGWPKNILHRAGIAECVAGLYAALPHHFCIVDGIVGMDGNGPLQGRPKPAGVIVAGRDLAAVDATCCRIMQVDPAKVPSLQLARPEYAADTAVEQIAEPLRAVQVPFDLPPGHGAWRLKQA